MGFSLGLLLICIGVVGTLVSLLYLIKALLAAETATHLDIEDIAMGYADNNNNETQSNKKPVHPAQTPVQLDSINIAQEHPCQNNDPILDEDNSDMVQEHTACQNDEADSNEDYIAKGTASYHDDETVLNEDSTNFAQEQNSYHEDDETVLCDDNTNPTQEQSSYRDDDETVLDEDTMAEIELIKL